MLILICSFMYLYYILQDLIPVYKAENSKVFKIYVALFAFSYALHLGILLDVNLLSPSKPIEKVVNLLFGEYVQK